MVARLKKWQREGFSTEWQYRKARAADQGYSLASYTRERRQQRASAEGYRSPAVRARLKRTIGNDPEALNAAKKADTLAFFGISEAQFKRIRTANRNRAREQRDREYMLKWFITNSYRQDIDEDRNNWSVDRVGYILSYYAAVVNPKTNFDTLFDGGRNKAGYLKNRRWKNGQPLSSLQQYKYLVEYGKLMSLDEFENRYGKNTPVNEVKDQRKFL